MYYTCVCIYIYIYIQICGCEYLYILYEIIKPVPNALKKRNPQKNIKLVYKTNLV